ncbi:hypothetical protein, partial [Streptomyces sp. SID3343]|uniref:hypothetical protein n=1 Tax=Streptomyces sp. SID3343 TaxID=2690260 RepID=UPI0013C01AA0
MSGAKSNRPRGTVRVDVVRVLICASVAGAAAAVLVCLLAWVRPVGASDHSWVAPLLVAVPVLATVAVLTAVATRLVAPYRIDRTATWSPAGPPASRVLGPGPAEAATVALAGAFAGVQAHLVLGALLGSAPATVRHLLAVDVGVPW